MPSNSEKILFKGKIFALVEKNIAGRKFEIAKRSPGVRLLITDGTKILITREHRPEQGGYDYRLPVRSKSKRPRVAPR